MNTKRRFFYSNNQLNVYLGRLISLLIMNSIMPLLETKHVFLDTSIYKSQNYLDGYRLKSVLDYYDRGLIELYTTSITRKEVLKNLNDDLTASSLMIKRFTRSKENELHVLRNTEIQSKINELKPYTDLENSEFKRIRQTLNAEVNDLLLGLNDIEIKGGSLNKVLNLYFDKKAPFQSEKENKKAEFPDAFVLVQLEEYCNEKSIKMFVVSSDGDMNGFGSDLLIPIKGLDQYLDIVTKSYDTNNLYQFIYDGIFSLKDFIIDEYKRRLPNEFESSGFDSHDFIDYQISDVIVKGIEMSDVKILDINPEDNEAQAQVTFIVDVVVDIVYDDMDTAVWDKEEREYIYIETVERSIDAKIESEFEVAVNNIPLTDKFEKEDIECYYDFKLELDGEINKMDF